MLYGKYPFDAKEARFARKIVTADYCLLPVRAPLTNLANTLLGVCALLLHAPTCMAPCLEHLLVVTPSQDLSITYWYARTCILVALNTDAFACSFCACSISQFAGADFAGALEP